MIVVTGAAGLLGNALLRGLLARESARDADSASLGPVKALVRPGRDTSCFSGLEVEIVEADVRDTAALTRAFRGAKGVFHLAGEVSIAPSGLAHLRQINMEGTRCVIEACKRAGVGRLVYASSVHALVEPPMGVCMDEDAGIDPGLCPAPYAMTKAEATLLVLDSACKDLEVVAVYPSGIIGPWDWRPSHLGQLLLDLGTNRLGAYVDGAYNFVDSRDVAEGMVAAYERGCSEKGYILCGHEVTVRQLLDAVEEVSGIPAPRLRLNFSFVRSLSQLIPAYYWITRQKPLFTTYSLDVIRSNCKMSYARAERDLGYAPRPFQETITDTIAWFRSQGLLGSATDERELVTV